MSTFWIVIQILGVIYGLVGALRTFVRLFPDPEEEEGLSFPDPEPDEGLSLQERRKVFLKLAGYILVAIVFGYFLIERML